MPGKPTPSREPPEDENRTGIPSIPASAVRWFYALFSLGTIYLTIANTVHEAIKVNAQGWLEIQSIATAESVQAAAASAAVSAILVEGGHMVLARIYTEKNRRKALEEGRREGRREGRQKGRQEGQKEVQAAWEAWNQRRLEAEDAGEVFNEAPPGSLDGK